MRIIICDDDLNFTNTLRNAICTYFKKARNYIPEISIYSSGIDLLKDNKSKDIVFLDVEMPGLDGINTGAQLKHENNKCIIIMITSYSEYLDDAMRINVFRYLSKPLSTQRLYRNLDDALLAYNAQQDTNIVFELKSETVLCNTSSILYIEMEKKKLNIHTNSKIYSFYGSINEYEKLLPKSLFYRSHKSYIVNLSHVVEFTQDTICLDNGQSAYLSKRKHSDFKKHWLLYLACTK